MPGDSAAGISRKIEDGGTGNKWWVFSGNIKGKYTGDINLHLDLSNMMRNELEDYEIDDDYHIKNLFK
jgi:hypothetical protein